MEARTAAESVELIGLVVFVTSAFACTLGARWFGFTCASLGKAGLKALETVGSGAVFFCANLAAGMIVIAAVRAITGSFVSHYILSDVSLLGLSLLQGMVFAWWYSASAHAGRCRGEPESPVAKRSPENDSDVTESLRACATQTGGQAARSAHLMNIGIVLQNEYPHVGLVRPRRLARSLTRAGHHAVILASGPRDAAPYDVLEEAVVHRFKYLRRSWLHEWLATASPLNLVWSLWIVRIARREKLDVLVSSNIRVAFPTLVAARWLRVPVILDLEENNREAVKLYPKTRVTDYLVRNSRVVGWLESLAARLSDHVWVVVEERLGGFSRKGQTLNKVSVLGNTPSLDEVHREPRCQLKPDRPFTLAYIGLFAPGVRSLELILDSLRHLVDQAQTVQLRIAGGRQMEGIVQQLGLEDVVTFSGFVPPDELSEWLQEADVGVIAYDVNEFTNTTISNKLFHYMAAGIPILATDMAPTRRIIEKVGCGRIIPRGSTPREIARILLELRDASEARAAMGARGQRAIVSEYNWESEFVGALRTIQDLHDRWTDRRGATS
jgi:glycosyltransferase involved in cell wall biosynthesis